MFGGKIMTIRTGIYFTSEVQQMTVRLPVNPSEYTVTKATDNTRYNVLDIGEIVVSRTPKLIAFSWDGLFPGTNEEDFVVVKNDFKPPEFYIYFFTLAQKNKERLYLTINRFYDDGTPIYDSEMYVIVEDFSFTEKGGETGDFYYSIALTEWRNYKPSTVTIQEAPQNVDVVEENQSTDSAVAIVEPQRETSPTVISVGDTVIMNGEYFYSSWGEKPSNSTTNLTTTVTRIIQNPENGQNYPVHIGQYGWVKMEQLQKVV